MSLRPPRAILFDLDGTLADTAPDLAAAANFLREQGGLAPAPYDILRPVASAGARGLIGAALDIHPGDERYEALKVRFLDRYEANMTAHSRLFDSVPELLAQLEARGIAWGIVTNKASRFTDKLAPQIGLGHAACIVSGDTTPHPKPHPAPLLEAARRLGIAPADCWYVGDDLRDIQAGRAADMPTVAAAWGYCGHSAPTTWEADALAHDPMQLLQLLP
ncbi:HAD-IA family hydrolase [Herbaspirillum sp. LeCh32-8]|uniref:HAD family hydrolase n=1 Tax=Herbaspirillum sp. LeCh32-8 TaxID=2821356 RepID=UPI001AEB301E|nr:HAD-IA family hydrolase [Herbaspirillum sp. LeCh32-8]MBP0597552.1 HAD-IA family hydrolase [Herbaspirillum sp. LeCh32-8]